MGFLAFIICILFSFGKFWYSIVGIALLFFQINLDYIDGLIARYRNAASINGIFGDAIVHSITEPLVFFGLTLGVFKNTGNIYFLIFGILAALFSFLASSVQHIKHQVLVIKLMQYAQGKKLEELKGKRLEIISTEEGKDKKFLFLKNIIKQILFYLTFRFVPFILIFAIIFNFTKWLLVFYGIALPIKWLITVFYEFKMDYKSLEFLFKPYQPKK